jgi:lipoate-protein ligase A
MLVKDISLSSPEENIIYDEVLLHLAERGRENDILRFWESPQTFIVLGQIGKEQEDLNIDHVKEDGILVLRRCSGGGTVVQGKGCLNYSLILSKERNKTLADLRSSYEYISGCIIETLVSLGVQAVFQPISDIALKENLKKFSGNAQKRSRRYILHHGTILYGFDLSKIARYLAMPKDVPEYRKGRSHLDFVTNISLPPQEIKSSMMKTFNAVEIEPALTQQEKEYLLVFKPGKPVVVRI